MIILSSAVRIPTTWKSDSFLLPLIFRYGIVSMCNECRIKCLPMARRGNQVRILSDPVTVFREHRLKIHCKPYHARRRDGGVEL